MSDVKEIFYQYIRRTVGWTDFAKTHTASSGKEYEEAFTAGFNEGVKSCTDPVTKTSDN